MHHLFDKYLNDTLTDSEIIALHAWLQDKDHRIAFETYLRNQSDTYTALQEIDFQKAYSDITNRLEKPKVKALRLTFKNVMRYTAIFVGLTITGFGIYYLTSVSKGKIEPILQPKITLELEDGTLKTLDETNSGIIRNNDGGHIVKHDRNKLIYNDKDVSKPETLVYNKLSVPFGKKFELVLSDGTAVFLNSGSNLRYPTKFVNNRSRDVFLDGEGYFIVKSDSARPFTVITNKLNIRVLGTKFNVSSYTNDSATETVLIEGSVGVYDASKKYSKEGSTKIQPGHRASFQSNKVVVDKVNIQKYIAWTEGKLYFVNDALGSIFKELERHFDVSIENHYQEISNESLTGTFENETLDQILQTFQAYAKFEYTINENQITITKPE